MRRLFPKIRVEDDPIYVQDGKFWTSAGASSGFDLALALVEEDLGFQAAKTVAQDLVMFLRRPGGQSQFSQILESQAAEPGPIRDVQLWALENLNLDLAVERLADRAAMSPRNFARVFGQQTGTTPARFVEQIGLEAARRRLESGRETIMVNNGVGPRRPYDPTPGGQQRLVHGQRVGHGGPGPAPGLWDRLRSHEQPGPPYGHKGCLGSADRRGYELHFSSSPSGSAGFGDRLHLRPA